tara:strand:+ start:1511 stop:1732 length:222 start_codon:yes stop_codon:yes gene_type:complete
MVLRRYSLAASSAFFTPLRKKHASSDVIMIWIIVAIGIASGDCSQVPTATQIAPAAIEYVFFPLIFSMLFSIF